MKKAPTKTYRQALNEAINKFKLANIKSARLDGLIILENVLKTNRTNILLNLNETFSGVQYKLFNKLINQRANNTPIAQIIGRKEFYGRNFIVNKNVLIPRPESENMIDAFKFLISNVSELKKINNIKLLDIGTGSGCLGITLKLEFPNIEVNLVDNDLKALSVAKKNDVFYSTRLNIYFSNLLSQVSFDPNIIVANLPYVPDKYKLNDEAKQEPANAIFGGNDGLDCYRELFEQIADLQKYPLFLLLESFPKSHTSLIKAAQNIGYTKFYRQDFCLVLKRS
jgi:release factor glutamine methyltransferase